MDGRFVALVIGGISLFVIVYPICGCTEQELIGLR
jgi:hypothetical protein